MPFSSQVVRVLLASPSNLTSERGAVQQKLYRWNRMWSERTGVSFLPVMWEHDSYPAKGRGQSVLNEQILQGSDVVVAFIGTTLGTPTGNKTPSGEAHPSGTAEEIWTADALGKPVHVWFGSDRFHEDNLSADPSDLTADRAAKRELVRVSNYQKSLRAEYLYGTFDDGHSLAEKVEAALLNDITAHGWGGRTDEEMLAKRAAIEEAVPLSREAQQERIDQIVERVRAEWKESSSLMDRKAKDLAKLQKMLSGQDWLFTVNGRESWVLTNRTFGPLVVSDYRLTVLGGPFLESEGVSSNSNMDMILEPGQSFTIGRPMTYRDWDLKAEINFTYKKGKQRLTTSMTVEG